MNQLIPHLKITSRKCLAWGLACLLLVLPAAGCSLIPDDMVETLPGLTSEITTATTEPAIVSSPLLITEIMSTNQATLQTADQNTPDWIEIWNSGSSDIDLTGYSLSDKLKKPNAWKFPALTLKAGQFLVVYASGLAAASQSDAAGEIHANFRLKAEGDELIMTSPAGQVLARLAIPALPADISYGLPPTATSAQTPYLYYGVPTPGAANGPDGQTTAAAAMPEPKYDLLVNEYMTLNKSWPDVDGDLPDWVELVNTGKEPLNLLGFCLSDDPDQPDKWTFPDVTVKPGGLIVVWLSGKEKPYDAKIPTSLQATFKLGAAETILLLSDAKGNQVIRQAIEALPANVSRGRKAGDQETWLYYPLATPGEPNETAGFSKIEGAISLKNRGFWINEVLAQDAVFTADGKVSQPDWIELYNGSDQPVQLNGYGISDRPDEPFRMKLGAKVLQPGEFLVVEPVGFGLSTTDETVYLTAPDKKTIDWFDTGFLRNGTSSGRGNTGGQEPADTRFFYASPTPGQANASQGYQSIALPPAIEVNTIPGGQPATGLYVDGSASVSLTSPQTGAVIRYTLDGSAPGESAAIYKKPLAIAKNTIIRCRAEFSGCLPSAPVSRTVLTDQRHDLPVVSIAIKTADFYDPAQGLYANFGADIERPAAISYYEADGTHGVDFTAGVALHGAYSRTEKQKSLDLNLRECYGDSQVIYPFFPDSKISTYKSLVLRTSGQDWKYTKLRDAFMSEVIEGQLELETMDWRPCVLYINGEYFGLYEIRDNIDKYYMATHFGADPDKVDLIKGNSRMLSGTFDAYKELLGFVKANDLRIEANYQHVLALIDEESLMDFVIAETFFNNLDSGNKKFWCERKPGAQWRWVFYDLDWAMFPSTYEKNILKYDLLDPAGHGQQNIFNSSLQVKLMANPAFEKAFIERYAGFINTTFATDRMLGILDRMTEQIRSEIPRQVERWGGPSSVAAWERNVAVLRRITSEKRGRMQVILQESFNLSAKQMHELFPEDY